VASSRSRSLLAGVVAIALASLPYACSEGDDAPHATAASPPSEQRAEGVTPADAELERLTTLGYIDSAPVPADEQLATVVIHDPDAVAPGWTLYTSHRPCLAELLDESGTAVRRWTGASDCRNWVNAKLHPDGDLLVTEGKGGVSRLAPDGSLRWRRHIGQHHDLDPLPDGRLALLLHERRDLAPSSGGPPQGMIIDDFIAIATPEGIVLERLSLYDVLEASDAVSLDWSTAPDAFHTNSVAWMTRPELAERDPLYALGHVLVSVRNQNVLLVVSFEKREIVWSWGQGVLDAQHDATVLPSGNFLVYDNGMQRGFSRVLEIEPLSGEIVWEYGSREEERFYSRGRGNAQRLSNGNTLIADSDNGRGFEVTPTGRIVWEFRNPNLVTRGAEKHRAPIWLRRYSPDRLSGS
jgi:hypothetical protein